MLDGGAGQPVWAPDGSALVFVAEANESSAPGGSFWNITVATADGALRVIDTVFVPKSDAPDTNYVQCVRPTRVSATRLVYAGWVGESGRLWSADISGSSPPLSLVWNRTDSEFCRPVASNGLIAVSAFNSSSESWTADILRQAPRSCGMTFCNTDADCAPDAGGPFGPAPAGCGVCIHAVQHPSTCGWAKPSQYQPPPGATVPGERWPIAGGLGVDQLQWRPPQGGWLWPSSWLWSSSTTSCAMLSSGSSR